MKTADSINFWTLIVAVISLIVSLRSCSYSSEAIKKANESNIIAMSWNLIALNANQLSVQANWVSAQLLTNQISANRVIQESISKDNAEKAFEVLYIQDRFKNIIYTIKNNPYVIIDNTDTLWSFIDIFEWIWWQYCSGIATPEQIRTYLGKALNPLCYHKQSLELYGWRKNGVAILCKRFFPKSDFSKFAKNEEKCNSVE